MSIEAQALGHLLVRLDESFKYATDSPHKMFRLQVWARNEAEYWVHPVQLTRNKFYDVWDLNTNWTRSEFLEYVEQDGIDPVRQLWNLRCIVLGDMNYRVENSGFMGWLKQEGHATAKDFAVLDNLSRSLKTPVGYNVASIIASVNVMVHGYRGQGTAEALDILEEDLHVLTQTYRIVHYRFLAEFESQMRAAVPVFSTRPFS